MRTLRLTALIVFGAACLSASPIFVNNFSFETLPVGWPTATCGGTCAYSYGAGAVPGWVTDNSVNAGEFIPGGLNGNPPAEDGNVLAYTNGGGAFISQTVGTVLAGVTYFLQVEVLHRTDFPMMGIVQLQINGVPVVTATGPDAGPGTWNNFTASYTASAADAGKNLTIFLTSNGVQGDFDNVRLNDSLGGVPEPATFSFLGLGLVALAVRRRSLR
jgi:hypothetical protein